MDKANEILSMLVSVITIIGAIFAFLLYFHNKHEAQMDKLSSSIEAAKKAISDLEKELISSSDSRLKKMLAQLSSRVQEIDEGYDEKIKKIRKQMQSTIDELSETKDGLAKQVESRRESPGKVIDLDKQKIEAVSPSISEQIAKHQKAIQALQLIVRSHEIQLKKLRGEE